MSEKPEKNVAATKSGGGGAKATVDPNVLDALRNQEVGQSRPKSGEADLPTQPGVYQYEVTELGSVGYLDRVFYPRDVLYMQHDEALKRNSGGRYLNPVLDDNGNYKKAKADS